MTDAHTPVVLDPEMIKAINRKLGHLSDQTALSEDQGSLRAARSVPTEGVTASGDDLDRRWAEQVHTARCWGRTSYSDEMLHHCYCDQPVENSPIPARGGTEAAPLDDPWAELERLAKAATPGPWAWMGNRHSFYLATTHSGRRYVMGFRRMGTQAAQPVFCVNDRLVPAADLATFEVGDGKARGMTEAKADESVYRYDINGFDAPDACFIAAANPATILKLIEAARLIDVVRAQSLSTFKNAVGWQDRANAAEARVSALQGEVERLRATLQSYREGVLKAFDLLCPTCKGGAVVPEGFREMAAEDRQAMEPQQ